MGRMGRYAFFNTEFEYKFRFGTQPSESIQLFGGVGNIHGTRHGNNPYHEWETEDLPYIEQKLQRIAQSLDIGLLDIPSYESSREGTYKVFQELCRLYEILPNEQLIADYILGACIYHQLLYQKKLTASYEF